MADSAYLVHLHQPFGHARHYLGWSADRGSRLRHHAAGTGSNLLRHVKQAGVTWSLVRVWPGATRTMERQLHNRGSAARLCPVCRSATQRVDLPGGGYLAPLTTPADLARCCARDCHTPASRARPWGRSERDLCELHACAYAARQHGAPSPFTTAPSA